MYDSTHPKVHRSALVVLAWTSRLQRRSKIRSPSQSIGRGSFGLPRRPPWPSTVTGRDLRGSPDGSLRLPKQTDAALMPFASRSARSYISRNARSAEAPRSCLSWGSSRPSAVPPAPRPLPVRPPATEAAGKRPFGSTMPLVDSRSALVVLHHRDGFLRDSGCELVASRCRPWGSSRFPPSRARLPLVVDFRRSRRELRGTRSPSSRC